MGTEGKDIYKDLPSVPYMGQIPEAVDYFQKDRKASSKTLKTIDRKASSKKTFLREVKAMKELTPNEYFNFVSENYEEIRNALEDYGFSWDKVSAHLFTLTGIYVFPNVLEFCYVRVSKKRWQRMVRDWWKRRFNFLSRFRK